MTTVTIHAEEDFAIALHDGHAPNRVNQWKAVYGCISKKESAFVRKAIASQHVIDEEMWK